MAGGCGQGCANTDSTPVRMMECSSICSPGAHWEPAPVPRASSGHWGSVANKAGRVSALKE